MKVIKREPRSGLIVAQAENLDDLWYLSQVISEGDLVKARTTRLVKGKEDNLRGGKGEKKPMNLSVRVEKAEFDNNSNRLRVLGAIEEGPDDFVSKGSHHTFELDEYSKLDIIKKRWSAHELQYLKDAEKAAKTAKVIICIVGDGEATVALVRDRGLHYIDTKENLGGKYVEGRDEKKSGFYSKLLMLLEDEVKKDEIQTVIIGGPAFEKRNFADYAKGKLNMQVVDTGNEGKTGIHEILKGGSLDKILGDARIAIESKFIERLLGEISKDGLAAYGPKEVKKAIESGAVEILLVSDKKLRGDKDIESLIESAKSAGSEFHVLNSRFEPGEKLEGFSGIAAILRYKV